MKFEVAHLLINEHGVLAVDPRQGNDSALLAVFDNPRSAEELARFLTWMYDQYLHHAPMESSLGEVRRVPGASPRFMAAEAATETRISPGGYAKAADT